MSYLRVNGGNVLSGSLKVSGAKNSSLGLIPMALLVNGKVSFKNMPNIRDVYVFFKLLEKLGVKATWNAKEKILDIFPASELNYKVDVNLAKETRGSIGLLCPLLFKSKRAVLPFPGGDKIGERPLDELMRGITLMGANVEYSNGLFNISRSSELKGIDMTLKYPSHLTTMLLITLASVANGKTVLKNVAKEPEIKDLIKLCRKMGVKVDEEGSSTIIIYGSSNISGCEFEIMPDRLQIGTYIIASLMTNGSINLPLNYLDHLKPVIDLLVNAGANITVSGEEVKIFGKKPYKPFSFETAPYPGIPTDLQAILAAFLTTTNGESFIKENVFEDRMHHIREFKKLGIETYLLSEREAKIVGGYNTKNIKTVVKATDIRAGMALVLCGLSMDKGSSIYIKDHFHISRGYSDYIETIKALNGDVKIVKSLVDEGEIRYESKFNQIFQ